MPPDGSTVFVVDDDRQVRDSLEALVDAMRLPVATFDSAASFHRYYDASMPGCMILDIWMPVQNGIELYEQLLDEGRRLPVIFITAHADVPTAVAAMRTGAIEFLEKPFDRDVLRERINRSLDLDAQWRLREAEYAEFDRRVARLTPRERETLELILTGKSNKQIARALFISERAVEMRRSRVMKRLDVRSIVELIDVAVTHRVLSELREAAAQNRFVP
ncbi:MAG: response regulator [Pirellulales bacterium]